MPVLEVLLQPGESVISEAGELSWMTQTISMTTHTQMMGGGGFFGAGNGNTTVSSGSEIKAETESSTLDLGLTEMDKGSWVMFEFPGFTTASTGEKLASMDELRQASDTSYYSDGHDLWVKLVVAQSDNGRRGGGGGNPPGFGGGTTIRVSK